MLSKILEDWALNMKKLDGSDYKERAIKTIWNVTAKVLQAKYEHEYRRKFNPFTDELFATARKAKNSKMKELGSCPLKRRLNTEVFTIDEYRRMLESCDENCPEGLQKKFFIIASYELFWRSGEARKCKVDHFKEKYIKDADLSHILIEYNPLFDKTTKENALYTDSRWLFENLDRPEICPVRLYRKLKDKRPAHCKTEQFFLATNRNRLGDLSRAWFNNQCAGRNQMCVWTKQVAEAIGIDTTQRKMSNHSLKMSAVVHLTAGGYLQNEISKLIGRKTTSAFPLSQANILQYEKLIKLLRHELNKDYQLTEGLNVFNAGCKLYKILPKPDTVKIEIDSD